MPTPEYYSWTAMRARCNNPSRHNYPRYGGLGVKVCRRWRRFRNFLADMGLRPSPRHTIDRWPDPHGDYTPENCRWATPEEQQHNRRGQKLTQEQVDELRQLRADGWAVAALGARYGLNVRHVRKIVIHEVWK